jgi:hypothetical protein
VIEWKIPTPHLNGERNAEGEVKSETKMEKSSLNIKSFRNLLSSQSRSYKIAPNGFHPTEVKLNGLSDESATLDDVYAVKINQKEQRNLAESLCGGLVRLVGGYNSSFCLTVLTPVACR